jgi:hypothetical protein
MEIVQQINEMNRRAKSGEPSVEDYLHAVSEEPRTEWFTALLREKNDELRTERERADAVAAALRTWHSAATKEQSKQSEADVTLLQALRRLGVVQNTLQD